MKYSHSLKVLVSLNYKKKKNIFPHVPRVAFQPVYLPHMVNTGHSLLNCVTLALYCHQFSKYTYTIHNELSIICQSF